jgi:pyruvate kinase
MKFNHRPQKRTKIVATLGPASVHKETFRKMILAGLDVVRFNFSHSQTDTLGPVIEMVRGLSDELNVPIAILGDLRGPRIRVGEIEGGSVELKTGQRICLTPQPIVGNQSQISVSFSQLAGDVRIGSSILLDDGNLELKVEEIKDNGDVICPVVIGGRLSRRAGQFALDHQKRLCRY